MLQWSDHSNAEASWGLNVCGKQIASSAIRVYRISIGSDMLVLCLTLLVSVKGSSVAVQYMRLDAISYDRLHVMGFRSRRITIKPITAPRDTSKVMSVPLSKVFKRIVA